MPKTPQPRLSPQEIARALGRPEPTAEQAAVIASPLTPHLVVAGAGSGKTATMVDRVVYLVANGLVRADQVLGLTFTRKAAGELGERMRSRLEQLRRLGLIETSADEDEVQADPTISTYHSYANNLVKTYGLRVGLENDIQLLGEGQRWQLMAQIVENFKESQAIPDELTSKQTAVEESLKLASDCAEHLVDPDQLIAWCQQSIKILQPLGKVGRKGSEKERGSQLAALKVRIFYAELIKRYQELKKQMQVLDYGDLIAQAVKLARQVPEVAATESQRFKVVLLDEFQDTSHAQMLLFSALFGEKEGEEPHPVMAVGDPKQSIYGFRGASAGQLFSFHTYFRPPSGQEPQVSYLTTAWRNDLAILDLANRVAQPLAQQPDWARGESSLTVPDLAPRPQVQPGRLLLGLYETESQEAEALAQLVDQQRRQHEGQAMPTMAVLCKKRKQMAPILEAFEARGIPYQVVGLGGLLETPEVVDMVSVLQVLSDPGRSDALMRILTSPRWRLGVADLLALADWAGFLKQSRENEIRFGIGEEDAQLRTEQEILDAMETQAGQATESSRAVEDLDMEAVLASAAPDVSDQASLVEAIETLPQPGWAHPRTGRSISREGLRRLGQIASELAYLRQLPLDDLTSLLYQIEATLLLDIELAARPGARAHTARQNLDAFYQAAAQYEAGAPRIQALLTLAGGVAEEENSFYLPGSYSSAASITGFLAWLQAAQEQEKGLDPAPEAPRRDAVQLLTLHASKGLEWDQVYIPALAQGNFPTQKPERWQGDKSALPWPLRGDRDYLPAWEQNFSNLVELDEAAASDKETTLDYRQLEDRRLAYVGFTRARSLLALTSSYWQGSRETILQPSDFLLETRDLDLPAHQLQVLHWLPEEQAGESNPQGQQVQMALWPYDPFEGPRVESFASLETLDEASSRAYRQAQRQLTGQDLTGQAQSDQQALESGAPATLTARQTVERAAANVLRGGLTENDYQQALAGLEKALGPQELARRQETDAQQIKDWEEETDLLLELLARPQAGWAFKLPPNISASQFVAMAEDPQGQAQNLLRPMPTEPSLAARRGSAFHAWVEEEYGSQTLTGFDLLEETLYEDYEEEEDQLNLEVLKKNFLASPWAAKEPYALEASIETHLGGRSIRGRIDAIFRQEEEDGSVIWQLVDWKTGRKPSAKQLEAKSLQLQLYRLAFARLHQLDPAQVEAYFFYAASGPEASVKVEGIESEQDLAAYLERVREAGQELLNP